MARCPIVLFLLKKKATPLAKSGHNCHVYSPLPSPLYITPPPQLPFGSRHSLCFLLWGASLTDDDDDPKPHQHAVPPASGHGVLSSHGNHPALLFGQRLLPQRDTSPSAPFRPSVAASAYSFRNGSQRTKSGTTTPFDTIELLTVQFDPPSLEALGLRRLQHVRDYSGSTTRCRCVGGGPHVTPRRNVSHQRALQRRFAGYLRTCPSGCSGASHLGLAFQLPGCPPFVCSRV